MDHYYNPVLYDMHLAACHCTDKEMHDKLLFGTICLTPSIGSFQGGPAPMLIMCSVYQAEKQQPGCHGPSECKVKRYPHCLVDEG